MIHPAELDFIHLVQEYRTPLVDCFFKFLNFFDRKEFFFVLIPILWLGFGWKPALKFFYIFLFNQILNHALKGFFEVPRPFLLDSSVGIISVHGYSFPSGAAQSTILLSGLLIAYWKSSWRWPIAISYTLLISFSRIFLGVHFPSDILAGWFFGALFLTAVLYLTPLIDKQLSKLKPYYLFLLNNLLGVLLISYASSGATKLYAAISIGLGLGLWISYTYNLLLPEPANRKEFFLRITIGVLGTFSSYLLLSLLPSAHSKIENLCRVSLLGLWLSLGSHLLCRALPKSQKKSF